jgi:PAS domain S-box-containing protein
MACIEVLYVEDDPEVRAIVAGAIESDLSFAVRSFESGEDALEATVDWSPDILLLDVRLPDMDGPTTLARLQQRPRLNGVPAVFMTGVPHAAALSELLATGAAGIIAKPFDPTMLTAQLNSAIYRSNRKLHEAFRRSEEKSALAVSIIESSDDAIIAKDLSGTILSWNGGAERLFNYSATEIVGRNIRLLIPQDLMSQEDQIISRILKGELIDHFETVRLRKDGTTVDISLRVSPIRDKTGKIIGASKIARDISERKQAEQQNRQLTRQLEQQAAQLKLVNQELDDFAFLAAHDLKAPLRAIVNASKWLEKDLQAHLNDRTRRSMALMRGRAERMAKLIDDLLEFSRVGRAQEATEMIPGQELIDNVLALLAPAPGFRVEIDPAFSKVKLSRMPLQQILMNLIGNAIKHHHQNTGCIAVTIEDRGGEYAFAVADDGPGIPAAHHDKIFQLFTTLRPRDQVEGSGMGLAIVRKQVELAGGSLQLDSAEGRGSTFRFTLPIRPPAGKLSS